MNDIFLASKVAEEGSEDSERGRCIFLKQVEKAQEMGLIPIKTKTLFKKVLDGRIG
jgi:hypothetical protein